MRRARAFSFWERSTRRSSCWIVAKSLSSAACTGSHDAVLCVRAVIRAGLVGTCGEASNSDRMCPAFSLTVDILFLMYLLLWITSEQFVQLSFRRNDPSSATERPTGGVNAMSGRRSRGELRRQGTMPLEQGCSVAIDGGFRLPELRREAGLTQ